MWSRLHILSSGLAWKPKPDWMPSLFSDEDSDAFCLLSLAGGKNNNKKTSVDWAFSPSENKNHVRAVRPWAAHISFLLKGRWKKKKSKGSFADWTSSPCPLPSNNKKHVGLVWFYDPLPPLVMVEWLDGGDEGHQGRKRGWVLSRHGVILTELGHGGSREPAKESLDCAKWQSSLAFDIVSRHDLAHIIVIL